MTIFDTVVGILSIGLILGLAILVLLSIIAWVSSIATLKKDLLAITKEAAEQFIDDLRSLKTQCLTEPSGKLRWDEEKINFVEKHIIPRLSSDDLRTKAKNEGSLLYTEIDRIIDQHRPNGP